MFGDEIHHALGVVQEYPVGEMRRPSCLSLTIKAKEASRSSDLHFPPKDLRRPDRFITLSEPLPCQVFSVSRHWHEIG